MSSSWMRVLAVLMVAGLAAPGAGASPRGDVQDEAPRVLLAELDEDEADQDADDQARDRAQRAKDREQEAKDRGQEARDREQEARDRKQEAEDQETERYDEATEALDEERWEEAVREFDAVVGMKGRKAEAARYWKAYAQNRAGRSADALATVGELRRIAPQSRWLDDAKALELEIRQGAGQRMSPEAQPDEDLKLMALNGLMQQSPERALPLLESLLSGTSSVKVKRRALFVLAQSGSPQARDILARVARGQRNPTLQTTAIKYLGLFGGEGSRQALAEIYASSSDMDVKKAILHGFMTSGDKARVLAAARREEQPDLRASAVQLLGVMGAQDELWELYRAESAIPLKKAILHAFFVGGGVDRLTEVLRTEQDPDLRREAIRSLGLVGGRSAELLVSLYRSEREPEMRRQVLNALFLQGNAKALVEVARSEKDPELRKSAVHWLSLMHDKEATDYLLELLNK